MSCIFFCIRINFTRRRARSASARAARALRWRAPPPPPSPHRLCCLFSRSLPSQFRISRIKILISNLDMTLHAPQGKAASLGGSASIGPTPNFNCGKTGAGKEVPPLRFASPSDSIRATRSSRGWSRAPPAACARAATRAAHATSTTEIVTESPARAHRQPARRPHRSRRSPCR